MQEKEVWRGVVGYETGYEVSTLGRLRSVERVVDYKKGRFALRESKILKLREGRYGYLYTNLCIDNVRKTLKIHRMVAIAFLLNPENKPQVNHIDGNKKNNRLDNLEWNTSKENVNHAYSIGLKKGIKGEKSHLSKITKEDVKCIIELYSSTNLSQREVGLKYNISQTQVSRIVRGVNW